MRWLLLFAACSGTTDPLLVVSVTAMPPLNAVQSLAAEVTAAGHPTMFAVAPVDGGTFMLPPAHSFGVEVPEAYAGALHLTLRALAPDGSELAHGAGDATTRAGQRSDLEITLGP